MNYVKISKCNKSNICVCFYLLEDANKILHEVTEEDWNTLKLYSNVFKVSLAYLILYLSFVCIRHSIYPNFKKLFLKLFRTRLL